jgi:hypothetical protein
VKLLDDHKRFIDDHHIRLSSYIRDALDDAMSGDRELPERTRRDTYGHDLVRTSVSLTDEHAEFIDDEDFVFTIFVHDVIEERIDIERKLDEIED